MIPAETIEESLELCRSQLVGFENLTLMIQGMMAGFYTADSRFEATVSYEDTLEKAHWVYAEVTSMTNGWGFEQ